MRAFILIISSILLLSCSHTLLKKEKFDDIEVGMTIPEVKKILGEPASIRAYDLEPKTAFFYYKHNSFWRTDYASVYFHKGCVSLLVYDSD